MAIRYDYFNSPQFQQAWAYSDRSQQSLGLTPEEYTYLQGSGFQPYQPNAQTNIQQIDGQWKNTYVQPGQTQASFQPVTSTPATAPTNTAYASSIQGTLPKPPAPQMTTPSTGGTNSAGSQPTATSQPAQETNVWATQPKPATSNALSIRAGATGGPPSTPTDWRSNPFQRPPSTPLPLPPLPGDPVGEPGYYPGKPPGPQTGYQPGAQSSPLLALDPREGRYQAETAQTMQGGAAATARGGQLNALQSFVPPVQPSTPAAGGFTEANDGLTGPILPAGGNGGNALAYPGGRGNYMGYGSNGGGLRVDPNYLPEIWDYKDSPEYQWRLAKATKGLNRNLLARGRSNSTFGVNALSNLQSDIAADEVNRQYQRALNANTQNYSRYIGANVENYGRTRSEDQTGWDRATQLDNTSDFRAFRNGEQDWNRNYQLANMGLGATNTGVQAGNATGLALAYLLSGNGATQAALAVQSGAVSGSTIQSLLNAGLSYLQIESLFGGGNNTQQIPSSVTSPNPGNFNISSLPTGTSPSWLQQGSTVSNPNLLAGNDFDFWRA